jgi:putative nucleotidyltransferase with HDIG domain
MSAPVHFLNSAAQAFATMALYEDGHPARKGAVDGAYQALSDLQDENVRVRFTFLGGEVLVGDRPLRELQDWPWGERLAANGIQRLEFTDRVTWPDFEAFLEEVLARISGEAIATAEVRQGRPSNIQYGTVGLEDTGDREEPREKSLVATIPYSLEEEVEGVQWLHEELKAGRGLQILEAEALVRSLAVAMHGDQAFFIPLLRLKEFDQYTVTHALNVSVLTMALAEYLGLTRAEVRTFGIAGLLHDLGKVNVPEDILNKPGKLSDEEREVINRHPGDGARIIIETEENLDLAAVVAYEHHIRIDGGGYPRLTFDRRCHQASDLVHVCDVFDALRTHRPYREAWSTEKAISIIEEGAGPEFHEEIARAFIQMMGQWETRVTSVPIDRPEIPDHSAERGPPRADATAADPTGGAGTPQQPGDGGPTDPEGGTPPAGPAS